MRGAIRKAFTLMKGIIKTKHRKSNSKNILFVLPGGLGDAVLFYEHLIRLIDYCQKERYGLKVLCGKSAKYMYINMLGIDMDYFTKNSEIPHSIDSRYKIIEEIGNEEFDYVIGSNDDVVISNVLASHKIAVLSNSEYRTIIWPHRILYKIIFDRIITVSDSMWIVDRYNTILADVFGISMKVRVPSLKKMDIKTDEKYIVISVDSSLQMRQWPLNNFCELICRLHHTYCLDIVVTGKSREQEDVFEPLNFVRDLRGKTSLEELFWFINNSLFVVGVDSGNIHIAAALGVQSFVLVAQHERGKFFPYSPELKDENLPEPICIASSIDYACSGCLMRKRNMKKGNIKCYQQCFLKQGCVKCLESISVLDVMVKIEEYMQYKNK